MTGELLAFAAMVMFATNILVTKAASNRLDVGTGFVISVAVNLLFAALVFAVDTRAAQRDLPAGTSTALLLFMLAGACATYLGRWFFFEAIARLGPAKASLFHVSSPAFTAIIAWLFLGETLPLSTVLAIVATIVGLFLVSTPPGALRAMSSVRRSRGPHAEGAARAGKRGWRPASPSASAPRFAYSVGNVFRGASVRQWNEPVAGAMLGAVAALALHLVIGSGHRRSSRELRDRRPRRRAALRARWRADDFARRCA